MPTNEKPLVVLDGYTANPGDLSWDGLDKLGPLTVYDRTPPEKTVERASGAALLFTNKTALPAEVIEALPKLEYIGLLSTGYDVADIEAAAARGIPVSNVPAYSTDSVAQLTFAHLTNLAQRVAHHAETVRAGQWAESVDFAYWNTPQVELAGRTLGVVGLGRIGQAVADIGNAFGMDVIAYNPSEKDVPGVEQVTLDRVFEESDAVTLHCPLTPDNHGLVDAERLAQMKETAFLVNTARGALIDEQALRDALEDEAIAGAGLDVLSQEPPPADHPLTDAPSCFVTPHVAWATRAARSRLMQTLVENAEAFLDGRPQNVVNDVRAGVVG
jgi:glycerate dehydrogenase